MKVYQLEITKVPDFLYGYQTSLNQEILSRLIPNLQKEDAVRAHYPELLVEEYYQNYQLHREDGPAVTSWTESGLVIDELYYLEGTPIPSEEEYLQLVYNRNLKKVLK